MSATRMLSGIHGRICLGLLNYNDPGSLILDIYTFRLVEMAIAFVMLVVIIHVDANPG